MFRNFVTAQPIDQMRYLWQELTYADGAFEARVIHAIQNYLTEHPDTSFISRLFAKAEFKVNSRGQKYVTQDSYQTLMKVLFQYIVVRQNIDTFIDNYYAETPDRPDLNDFPEVAERQKALDRKIAIEEKYKSLEESLFELPVKDLPAVIEDLNRLYAGKSAALIELRSLMKKNLSKADLKKLPVMLGPLEQNKSIAELAALNAAQIVDQFRLNSGSDAAKALCIQLFNP